MGCSWAPAPIISQREGGQRPVVLTVPPVHAAWQSVDSPVSLPATAWPLGPSVWEAFVLLLGPAGPSPHLRHGLFHFAAPA